LAAGGASAALRRGRLGGIGRTAPAARRPDGGARVDAADARPRPGRLSSWTDPAPRGAHQADAGERRPGAARSRGGGGSQAAAHAGVGLAREARGARRGSGPVPAVAFLHVPSRVSLKALRPRSSLPPSKENPRWKR